MTATLALRIATTFLNQLLATYRVEMLQTQDGRATLDTLPESQRRMLKQATAAL